MTQTSPPPSPELQRELQAHLETLRELGPGYSDTVAASLMQRLDRMVDEKIEARLSERNLDRARTPGGPIGMAAVTMGLGIPLTAIAGGIAEEGGILIVWLALVIINVLNLLPRPR